MAYGRAVRHISKSLALASIVFGVSVTSAADSIDTTSASTYQSDMAKAGTLIFHLSRFNYSGDFVKRPDYGRQVLLRYMDQLDPEHIFFSAEDATDVLKHADTMLAAIQGSDTSVAETVAAQHVNRVKQRIGYALTLIDKGFTFDGRDTIVINAPSVPDFLPEDALRAKWEKIIKSDWLNLKLEGLSESQIKDRLTSRYSHFSDAVVKDDQAFALVRYIAACIVGGDPAGGYSNALHGERVDDALASESVLALNDDADGPVIRTDSGGAGADLKAGDRVVGMSVGGGDITYLDGESGAAATALLKSFPQDGDVKLYIRRAGTLPGAPIVEVPYNLKAAPTATRLRMRLLTPSAAAHGESVAVITIPVMYGFAKRKGDGATSPERVDVDLREALTQARSQGAVAVVVDLRDDSGGYVNTVARVAQVFLGDRSPWRTQTKTSTTSSLPDSEEPIVWDGPLTVLVNRRTAEGGEMVAAALQDYGRALIVGDKTAGDGNIATVIDLNRFTTAGRVASSDLGNLKMTVGGIFRADGQSIAGRGVTPDVMVSQPVAANGGFKEEPFPAIGPVPVDGFTAFKAADAEVARNYLRSSDASPDHGADALSRLGDELSLNFSQRKSERRLQQGMVAVAEEDFAMKEAVEIAYEQSRAMGSAASASVSTAAARP